QRSRAVAIRLPTRRWRPLRWRGPFSSSRPCRRSDRCGACGCGSRRSSGSSGAATIRRRLLDRMPLLVIGPDRAQQVILVRPFLAAAVVFWFALPDADFGNEDDVVEIFEARLVCRERLFAGVARLDATRALKHFLQAPAIGEDHLLLAGGRAFKDEGVPELALRVRPIDDDEFTVEHLGVAL